MGPAFRQYLDGHKVYSCASCKAHVADHDDIVSKVRDKRKRGSEKEREREFLPSPDASGDDDERR